MLRFLIVRTLCFCSLLPLRNLEIVVWRAWLLIVVVHTTLLQRGQRSLVPLLVFLRLLDVRGAALLVQLLPQAVQLRAQLVVLRPKPRKTTTK